MTVRVVSYGGGVQSTALLVLAGAGLIDFRTFLFANVGDHAEGPATLRYLAEHAAPYAAAHGIELVQLRWVDRWGHTRDLYDDVVANRRSIDIPVRMGSGGFGHRRCTDFYKIRVVARECRRRGATRDDPAVVALGISCDEVERAKVGVPRQQPWTTRVNPLLDLGLDRAGCYEVIAKAGLPAPPKSACWFCPFSSGRRWQQLRLTNPPLFRKAEALDRLVNRRHQALTGTPAGLAAPDKPLREATAARGSSCDGGYCFT